MVVTFPSMVYLVPLPELPHTKITGIPIAGVGYARHTHRQDPDAMQYNITLDVDASAARLEAYEMAPNPREPQRRRGHFLFLETSQMDELQVQLQALVDEYNSVVFDDQAAAVALQALLPRMQEARDLRVARAATFTNLVSTVETLLAAEGV